MSLIRSGSTLVPLLPSGSRYSPAPGWPDSICFERRGRLRAWRPGQGRAAVDELLADQRLRPDQAAGVAAEVLEAGVGDVHHDHRLAGDRDRLAVFVLDGFAGLGDVDRFDRADVGAGDADLLAVDHEGAVVEDRPDPVAAGFAAAGDQQDDDDDRHHQCRREDQPFDHGPGGASAGLHSELLTLLPANGGLVYGLEPSAALWVAPPGQRRRTEAEEPKELNCSPLVIGFRVPPSSLEDVLRGNRGPHVVAVAVVVARRRARACRSR